MRKITLIVIAACLGLSAPVEAEWQGRVLDMERSTLAGAKVSLHPQGITAYTDGNGNYRLSESASLRNRASRLPLAGNPPAGLRLGFQVDAQLPARDPAGRRLRPENSRWIFIAPLLPPSSKPPAFPLAKPAGVPTLKVEKPGYLTASVSLAAGESLPDIFLAKGLDLSRPVVITNPDPYTVPPLPRAIDFSGGTSTELPNLRDLEDSVVITDSALFILRWNISTESGVQVYVRPHIYFPRFPEKNAATAPDRVSDDLGRAEAGYLETAYRRNGNLVPPENSAIYVNLLLWKKPSGSSYGAMRCQQFLGPIRAAEKAGFKMENKVTAGVQTVFAGEVPALDLGGKVAGKIAWQGPGPLPELWVGLLGTELFAEVSPDGSFLSTDLPPGKPPVVLVRVERSVEGAALPRAFQVIEGLEIVSGQTAVLDSIILSGE